MDMLKNPYVYSSFAALASAGICLALMFIVDPVSRSQSEYKKTFVRVLIATFICNVTLQYMLNIPEPVSTEPYAMGEIAAQTDA